MAKRCAPLRTGKNVYVVLDEFLADVGRCVTKRRFLHFHFEHGMHEGLQRNFCALGPDARFQAAESIHPACAPVREHIRWRGGHNFFAHHDGHEEIRNVAQLDAIESPLRDSDDCHAVIIHENIFADDGGIARKTALPETVAQHDDGMSIGNAVVIGSKSATDRGGDTEHVKISAGDELRFYKFRAAIGSEACGAGKPAKHSGENFVVILKIAKHWIGNRVAAPVVTVVVAAHREQHKLLRIFYGKQAQKNLVEQSEHRGVRADSEGESEDGNGGESWISAQHSQPKAHIVEGGLQKTENGHSACPLFFNRKISESALCVELRVAGAHAAADGVGSAHFEMRAKLFFELGVALPALPHATNFAQPSHNSRPPELRTISLRDLKHARDRFRQTRPALFLPRRVACDPWPSIRNNARGDYFRWRATRRESSRLVPCDEARDRASPLPRAACRLTRAECGA